MDQEFQDTVKKVRNGKPRLNVSNEIKLKFYALYKQSTVGDINISCPGIFDPTGRAKWSSWNSAKGMKKDKAKENYIKLFKHYY